MARDMVRSSLYCSTPSANEMLLNPVCRLSERYGYGRTLFAYYYIALPAEWFARRNEKYLSATLARAVDLWMGCKHRVRRAWDVFRFPLVLYMGCARYNVVIIRVRSSAFVCANRNEFRRVQTITGARGRRK